jgi:hypothetical protein
MKTNILKFVTVTLISSIVLSCGKENPPASQKVLFQVYSINYAWGYSHGGIFIDNEGRVMKYYQSSNYSNPNSADWNFPDDDGYISEQALMENIQKATETDIIIDEGTLKKYADKIYLVKENYTEHDGGLRDAGAVVYACYKYDEKPRMYKEVLLYQRGDWVKKNNNIYANQISNWLEKIWMDYLSAL